MARIEGIQRQRDYRFKGFLLNLENRLLADYARVLNQEEILWFKKSRAQWLASGDCNTRFYHISTLVRRKHNKIESLKLDSGEWCTDDSKLLLHAKEYFHRLFGELQFTRVPLSTSGVACKTLNSEDCELLSRPVSFCETTQALRSMNAHKAPGPDGFNPLFFQKY